MTYAILLNCLLLLGPPGMRVSFEDQVKSLAKAITDSNQAIEPLPIDSLKAVLPDSIEGIDLDSLMVSAAQESLRSYVTVSWGDSAAGISELALFDTGYHPEKQIALLALSAAIGDFAAIGAHIHTINLNGNKAQITLEGEEVAGYNAGQLGIRFNDRVFLIIRYLPPATIDKEEIFSMLKYISLLLDLKALTALAGEKERVEPKTEAK